MYHDGQDAKGETIDSLLWRLDAAIRAGRQLASFASHDDGCSSWGRPCLCGLTEVLTAFRAADEDSGVPR